ncbi:hypothetical protein A2V56_03050 [Candidatus Woesebacteria bacterium RBG_19FT_COMBO_42_9]|uniref:Carrier domain-containing protein n=1 Tax=Candidatus Woesebacteria bacterium RBG_16_42_24 TaxID=1802485 RepID=A0A1F7XK06_9BACT|nr:MAG: hypothetical protein A2V97_02055 [Candidatus Woesebacteria bacterium RBG_16_42_24]OGM16356.1 MAG: hypothetical protein A2V56_03050 [Candidatus Woesebacteria bacterium RBG_19FT_COMBO_42_9]OGM67405.1 MAG: hypothetical protein A2985_04670 [Candidatus Woesebacteria bacterium RIFCSPLOWO2_01_FULL_43_11]
MDEVSDSKTKIKELLSSHIGVEPEDIDEEDFFSEDLHMTPTDLTDFTHLLEKEGFNTTHLDFTELETVGDLIEALSSHEEIK